ncbi:hypothetical protein LX73_0393 [Fodinibius salinus]|uniref:Purine nucleoside phosphorylase n=1 Tax=Fodinibius salinus TaxID=860790 RepID=A0A5D3YPD5_9BACT|nr:peptidoglycan editing factor PgeF [Fodinibius salinus]TYP95098.1 hypothetical protein LX73_0393 [Fodinibius salinus]
MSNSKTELSVISPKILDEQAEVRAWFTLKNPQYKVDDQLASGLNLGRNTPEHKNVINRNRTTLYETLDINPQWVATADQVHSNKIEEITEGGTFKATDGLITRIPGLTLAIQVADCAAILLWDEHNKIVAALHAGWRGAVADIVPMSIEHMTALGGDPQKTKAFVSPCISVANFEVGHEVAEQFPDQFVDYESYKKPHVDLKRFLEQQLREGGLLESNIEIRSECTIANAEQFYSYRREGDQSGRMMALIQISEHS